MLKALSSLLVRKRLLKERDFIKHHRKSQGLKIKVKNSQNFIEQLGAKWQNFGLKGGLGL
jgi:hypothetical protein